MILTRCEREREAPAALVRRAWLLITWEVIAHFYKWSLVTLVVHLHSLGVGGGDYT